MRAAIYSPYLETLGGGERYIASVGRVLVEEGWEVYLEAKNPEVLKRIHERFGLEVEGIKTVETLKRGEGYDLCFWLSDGSIPMLFGRNNILHFQRPFFNVDGRSLLNRMKLFRINKVVVNSEFTKGWIDKEFPVESIVLYPPVDVEKFKSGKKENAILYVGRFSQLEQSKRQDVLVYAFKKLFDKVSRIGRDGERWKLILAGGSDVGRTNYVEKLKETSKGYPVEIVENPTFGQLKKLYSLSKFFWSAAGYGVNEKKEPNKLEHFGISVVEAMAAKSLPLVYDGGGHKEVIKEGKNGCLWKEKSQLVKKTLDLMEKSKLLSPLVRQAKEDAKTFSYERFKKELLALL